MNSGEFGVLEVLNEESGSKKIHSLKPGVYSLGSSVDAKIRIRSKGVEGYHCIVTVNEDRVATLESVSTFPPTLLNSKAIRKNKKELLNPGDVFIIGDVKILYRNDTLPAQQLQEKRKLYKLKPKIFGTPKPKMLGTPRRGSCAMKRAVMAGSIQKKFNSPAFRYVISQRRQSLSDGWRKNWQTDSPVPEALMPSERNIIGDLGKGDVIVVSEPLSEDSPLTQLSKSGSTTSRRDGDDTIKRKSASLMKLDSSTPIKSARKSYARLSAEEAPDFPISDEDSPKTTLNCSVSKQPKQLAKTRRVSDLTNPVLLANSQKKINKSFASFSNTPETPSAIFKTPTSVAKRSSKFNKSSISIGGVTPSPARVATRSRSLSTTFRQSRNNTLEQSIGEAAEQIATVYEDDEQSDVSLFENDNSVGDRSRSLTRRSASARPPVNDTLNKSADQVVSSSESITDWSFRRSCSLASRPFRNNSLKVDQRPSPSASNVSPPKQFEDDVLASPSSNVSGRRSRRSLVPRRHSQGNTVVELSTSTDSSSGSEIRRSKNLQSGNLSKNHRSYSSSTASDEEVADPMVDSSLNSEGSADGFSSNPEESSTVETTGSSSFVFKNSRLSTPVLDTSKVETPKQVMSTRSSRSLVKSGRCSTKAKERSVSSSTTDSSSNIDDDDDLEDAEDDSPVAVKTPKKDTSAKQTPRIQKSPISDLTNGIKRSYQFSTPALDISGIETLTKTPKQVVSTRSSRSLVKSGRRSTKTKESSVSPLMSFTKTFATDLSPKIDEDTLEGTEIVVETPMKNSSAKKTPKIQKSPIRDSTNVHGVKRPRPAKSPKNDLSDVRGVRKMLQTPKAVNSPQNDLRDVRGVKRLLTTPAVQNSPVNDLRDVRGVKRLMKTPKVQNSPKNDLSNVPAFKHLFEAPKSPANDLSEVRGIKRLMKTPKTAKGPKNDLSNLPPIKHLFVPKSPKNDLRDVKGVKGIMKTPKAGRSPRNDLRNPPEFKKLFELPKSSGNELEDFEGVPELMATPAAVKSSKKDLMDGRGNRTSKIGESPKIVRSERTSEIGESPKTVGSERISEIGESSKIVRSERISEIGESSKIVRSERTSKIGESPKTVGSERISEIGESSKIVRSERTSKIGKSPKTMRSERTSKIGESPKTVRSERTSKIGKSPRKPLSDVEGIDNLMKTPDIPKPPKIGKSPKNDLSKPYGVKRLLATPKPSKSPRNDLTDVEGVDLLMKTPNVPKPPEIGKSPKNNLSEPCTVQKMLATPKPSKSPRNDLSDVDKLMKTPNVPKIGKSPKNDLSKPHSVKKLLATPKPSKSPRNDLSDVEGIDKLMKTPNVPKIGKSPKNDLSKPYGVKRLMATPKPSKSPRNDLSDVEGVDLLMKTPKSPKRLRDNDMLNKVLSAIQIPKTDRNRRSVLSPNSDYTDVRGVKRMFAEEEAMVRNSPNVSGVANLFEESTPTSSEMFTTLFNKKPLRTYPSKSPPKLNKARMRSLEVSPTEVSVSSDVVDWVKTVNEQLAASSVREVSPNKHETAEIPMVGTKRSNRLAAKTLTPSINGDSPLPGHKGRSTKKKPISSTPLADKIDSETEEVTDGNLKAVKKTGILKEPNAGSPVAGSKRTRRNRNVGETAKENLTPDASDVDSVIQAKKVTFDIQTEETRRSKRTPQKPARFAGFISDLSPTNHKNKEVQEESQPDTVANKTTSKHRGKQVNKSEESETIAEVVEVKKPTKRGRGKQVDENEESITVVEVKKPAKKGRGKGVDENEESATIAEVVEVKKPTKRGRGKGVDVNEESVTIAKVVENKKPAKRLRGKQNENEEPAITAEVVEDKKPTRGRPRKLKINNKTEQSELNDIKDPGEIRPVRARGKKPQVSEKIETESESECSSQPKPAKRGRQKPAAGHGQKRINDEEAQVEESVQRHGRKNGKIQQPEEEIPKSTRGRPKKAKLADEDENHNEESAIQEKTVKGRGRNAKAEQSKKADVEEVKKPILIKRGRKAAVKEEESDEDSETTTESDAMPPRRTNRRAATKAVDYVDDSDSMPPKTSQGKRKRATKEIAEDAPIRKSTRTRR